MMADFQLGLSRLDADLRAYSLGGSDCTIIAAAQNHLPDKSPQMHDLERMMGIKLGDEPPDLTQNVSVILGIWNEPLVVYLYECFVGDMVFDRNATVDHPDIKHCRASLDGRVVLPGCTRSVLEAKWTAATNMDAIVTQYYAQLQNNLDCDGVDHAVLAAIKRGQFDHVVIERDDAYLKVLRERQEIVWSAVQDGRREVSEILPPMPKPERDAIVMRPDPVDLSTLPEANEIGYHAAVFCETYTAAKAHVKAKKEIAKRIPKDAAEITGLGLRGKRDARKALTVVPDIVPDDDGEQEEY